jgi:hypothetical protein
MKLLLIVAPDLSTTTPELQKALLLKGQMQNLPRLLHYLLVRAGYVKTEMP